MHLLGRIPLYNFLLLLVGSFPVVGGLLLGACSLEARLLGVVWRDGKIGFVCGVLLVCWWFVGRLALMQFPSLLSKYWWHGQ
jgi:hypothetical protein